MHIIVLYLVGIILGRLTSILTGWRSRQRDFVNVSTGILGALFGGLFLAHALGAPTELRSLNGIAVMLAVATAALLLALLSLLRHRFQPE